MYHPHASTHHTSSIAHTSIVVNLTPTHSLRRYICNTNSSTRITGRATTSSTLWYHDKLRPTTSTYTTEGHRPSSKNERNLITVQVNINGIKNNPEELKLLIHDTHADIITIQETKRTPKAKTPNVHNFTTVRTDRSQKAGCGLITLNRDNITFTTTDISSTINTHNT